MSTREIISGPELLPLRVQRGLSLSRRKEAFIQEIREFGTKVIFGAVEVPEPSGYLMYHWLHYNVYVHTAVEDAFRSKFRHWIDPSHPRRICYDNLVNVCIMVKNPGEFWETFLTHNKPLMDSYTILDTGSTDDTVAIARRVLADVKGEIHEEKFLNFRDSRNRLLDLAGTSGFFNIMLDDTYLVEGISALREFLDLARGDDVASSFSIPIRDADTTYLSNRVTKSANGLRYIHKVHEVIQSEGNLNVTLPPDTAYIQDVHLPYMSERTLQRKQADIDQLKQMLEEAQTNPGSESETARILYYIAMSYICLQEWSTALEWFTRRVAHPEGYGGETQDSLYYIAVLKFLYLGYPWEECSEDFCRCYQYDPSRADVLYFMGKHYLKTYPSIAYLYWKQGFELGMPEIQMSVREPIYHVHLPMDLAVLCYTHKNYPLGLECARRTLRYEPGNVLAVHWNGIYTNLVGATPPSYPPALRTRESFGSNKGKNKVVRFADAPGKDRVICFVSAGGWDDWSGATLLECGLGGSETFSIRYAEQLTQLGWHCIVWCRTHAASVYNGVHYRPISGFSAYAATYQIDLILLNRTLELLPLCYLYDVPVYFIYHDVAAAGEVLIRHPNLKGIFGLSDWHLAQIQSIHRSSVPPDFIQKISYCIPPQRCTGRIERYSFIYPNFPNRGLLVLLRDMWPKIIHVYPQARLDVFCDLQNSWCQTHWKADMDAIEKLLQTHQSSVTNHGWVKREVLDRYWTTAHVWLYPCTFAETCCLTAWEAAASRTLAVSNRLAALETSVGDRGITLAGDATDERWQTEILQRLFRCLDYHHEHLYLDVNEDWSRQKTPPIVVGKFHREYLC